MMNLTPAAKLLSLAAALSATTTIAAGGVRLGGVPLGDGFTPLTTLLILGVAVVATAPPSARYRWSICAGLVCSLVGDVLLMLPRDRFLAGLSAFLLAHLCYLSAFTADSRFAAQRGLFVVCGLLGVAVVAVLWPRVPAAHRWPVAAQAGSRARLRRNAPALAAAIGAALFVLSDTLLAVRRFHGALPASRLLVLGSYFAAQWLIAWSVHSDAPRRLEPGQCEPSRLGAQ